MRSWLFSTVVAFLDWHVRGRAEAEAWLRSDDVEAASGGAVTWDSDPGPSQRGPGPLAQAAQRPVEAAKPPDRYH